MVIIQKRSHRKPSGARYKKTQTKRLRNRGSSPARTAIGERRSVVVRTKGGNLKNRLLAADVMNVLDPKKKQFVQAKVLSVAENAANRHYVRRNIMTKGTVVVTDKGKARVTNRPGQEGSLQGILLE